MDKYEIILEERGIKPTAIRLWLLKTMLSHKQAFSLSDLEQELETFDKSTLFRTISLFHDKKLLHSIDDGSGSVKYSVCHDDCSCEIEDLHVHFACQKCKKTVCLEKTAIPEVRTPKGFVVTDANFVLKGFCDECSSKKEIDQTNIIF